MRKHTALAGACLGALLVAVAGTAFAGSQSSLAAVRQATAAFLNVAAAKDAGYTLELPDVYGDTCIANLSDPSAGAMGVHLVNTGLLDAELDVAEPEVLVYERRNNGSLKLVAVEYVAFEADVPGQPSLFGVPFDSNDGTRYDRPPFWALHAWIWKPNPTDPAGIFAPWNPRVSC
jgi:hypothetical protein